MKIIFNSMRNGLGNNGGSSTIIKSANTLTELGHEVIIIDTQKNMHTWNSLKAKHLIIKSPKECPPADVAIATGFKTVETTLRLPVRLKCHWIRAWEEWQMNDFEIRRDVLNVPTVKIVNSICLKNQLSSYGIDSYIIRPGYDFDKIYDNNTRIYDEPVILGGLYREGIHGKRKRTNWVLETAKRLKKIHNVKLWMFGSERKPKNPIIDLYLRSPSSNEKNIFLNSISIWLAPSMSEGLHMPPAEAMITGCPVISTNAMLSGTQDYVIDKVTGLVSENNLDSFVNTAEVLIKRKDLRQLYGRNGKNKILSLGDRTSNMKKMVSLFEKLLKTEI